MRPPVQRRSEASLERLLAATDRLVREGGFQKSSLNRICAEAGLTTGAFYARFGRKEELAVPLWHRYEPRSEKVVRLFVKAVEEGSLERAVNRLMRDVIRIYKKDGSLIRELVSMARSHPDLAAAMRATNERHLQHMSEAIGRSRTGISHPEPQLAIRLGLVCILNTLRELVLDRKIFEESSPLQPRVLATELTRILLSYLRS